MPTIIANSFSLQMVPPGCSIRVVPLTLEQVKSRFEQPEKFGQIRSVIGHADTARLVSRLVGHDVPCNRESITLRHTDKLIVAQVTGGRLPEGCTELPPGIRIEWRLVMLEVGTREVDPKAEGIALFEVPLRIARALQQWLADRQEPSRVRCLLDDVGNPSVEVEACGFRAEIEGL